MDDIVGKISADIANSGFPVEASTGTAFSRPSWKVLHQMVFRDYDENKSRTLDVLAIKEVSKSFHGYSSFFVWCFAECKKSEKPWVFYVPPTNDLQGKATVSNYLKVVANPKIDLDASALLKKSHYFSKPPVDRTGQAYRVAFSGRGDKASAVDQIWSALNQATKSTYFFLNQFQKELSQSSKEMMILYPLIVLDGRMFMYEPVENGKNHLEETEYVKFSHQLITPNGDLEFFLVDVVTTRFLSGYIDWLEEEGDLLTGSS